MGEVLDSQLISAVFTSEALGHSLIHAVLIKTDKSWSTARQNPLDQHYPTFNALTAQFIAAQEWGGDSQFSLSTLASVCDALCRLGVGRTWNIRRLPVQLLDSVSRCLPDVWGQVGRGLLDGQHHDGDDNGHPDAGQNPKCAGPNELVWVLEQEKKKEKTRRRCPLKMMNDLKDQWSQWFHVGQYR